MNKCPMCEKELATYQVSRLGEDGGSQEREVGCAKQNAPCLLAGHSWPLSKWDELCRMVASAGEGYPGAAHDRLTVNNTAVRGAAEPRTLDGLVGETIVEDKR